MNVYAISLCFNRHDIVRESLAQYEATKSGNVQYRHILVDQHYPLPNKQENRAKLRQLGPQYEVLDPGRNLGLHHGFNWACSQLPLKDDDILIGYDPDSYPVTPGWDMALVTAIAHGGNVAWASLMNPISRRELDERGFTPRRIGHIHTLETHRPCVNSICAWRWDFLRKAGGLKEPTAFYGGLECAMWKALNDQKQKWVYLLEWHEKSYFFDKQDMVYRDYKWHHAHTGQWPGDFESYLHHRGINF